MKMGATRKSAVEIACWKAKEEAVDRDPSGYHVSERARARRGRARGPEHAAVERAESTRLRSGASTPVEWSQRIYAHAEAAPPGDAPRGPTGCYRTGLLCAAHVHTVRDSTHMRSRRLRARQAPPLARRRRCAPLPRSAVAPLPDGLRVVYVRGLAPMVRLTLTVHCSRAVASQPPPGLCTGTTGGARDASDASTGRDGWMGPVWARAE